MTGTYTGRPVLALDFDGVLSESLLEAYLLTWNIAGRVDPALAWQLDEAPTIDTIHAFRDSHRAHYDTLERIVPFGNRCEDYLVMQLAVERGHAIGCQEDFDSFKESVDRALQDRFHEQFYVLRYDLAQNQRDKWLALNAPYPGIIDALRSLAGRFELCIATSKDRETVFEMLQSWGLFGHFGQDRVLDKRAGASKRAHLAALRSLFGCGYQDMSFVDDKVSHLLDCRDLGVRLLLSGWGYNGELEHSQAAAAGIGILDIKSFSSLQP
jgi:phosphoglycolate phosphatase-like HAD superfamily hydrolase